MRIWQRTRERIAAFKPAASSYGKVFIISTLLVAGCAGRNGGGRMGDDDSTKTKKIALIKPKEVKIDSTKDGKVKLQYNLGKPPESTPEIKQLGEKIEAEGKKPDSSTVRRLLR